MKIKDIREFRTYFKTNDIYSDEYFAQKLMTVK